MSQQSALPHLPQGMTIPQVQISAEPMMPGQKMITSGQEQPIESELLNDNQQPLSPPPPQQQSLQSTESSYRRSTQGIPFSERANSNQMVLHAGENPPPMFSAQPKRIPSIRRPMDIKLQKDVYRLESGIDPVGTMSNRLESWRLAIKNLVGVFKKIGEVEDTSSKGWVGAGRTIQVPFPASNGQFLQEGGIQDVWSSIRDYSNEQGILHRQFAVYVSDTLVPSLRDVKGDIKKMILSIQNDKQLKSTEIFECRMRLDKNIARLEKNIQAIDRSPHTASQCVDPFLINLAIIHDIRELCDHENRLHDSALALQKEVGVFEQKIIENCRFVMHNLHNFRLEHKMEGVDNIGLILQTFDNIQPLTEWSDFIRRNQNSLVMENSAYKNEDSIPYPNQSHKYVRASKIGQLSTKQGSFTKTWVKGVCILTPAGFLHGYKTPQHFQTNPTEPTFTMFIPDTTIIPSEDRSASFKVKYKNQKSHISLSSFNGSLSSFNTRSSHTILADSHPESQEWQDALSTISARFELVPLIGNSLAIPSVHQQNRNLPSVPAHILPPTEGGQPNTTSRSQGGAEVYAPGYTEFQFNQAPPNPKPQPPLPQQHSPVVSVATVDPTGYSTNSIHTAASVPNSPPPLQKQQQYANMDAATAAGMSIIQNPTISPYDILNMASAGVVTTSSVPSTGDYADPALFEYETQHLNDNQQAIINDSVSVLSEDDELIHQNQEAPQQQSPVAHTLPNPGNPFDILEPVPSAQQPQEIHSEEQQQHSPVAYTLPIPGNPFDLQEPVPSVQQPQEIHPEEQQQNTVASTLPNPGNPFDIIEPTPSAQQPQEIHYEEQQQNPVANTLPNPGNPFDLQEPVPSIQQPVPSVQQPQEDPVTNDLPKLGNPFELDQQKVNDPSTSSELVNNTIESVQQEIQDYLDTSISYETVATQNIDQNKQPYEPGLNLVQAEPESVQPNSMDNKDNSKHSV